MTRNYVQIEKEIAKTGFFSEYLPPCFKLNSKVLLYPPANPCDLIPPLRFTMSRFNGNDARRSIFVPEIGAYLVAREFMKEHQIIKEIIEFSETSEFSFSPILSKNDDIMRHEGSYLCEPDGFDGITSDYIENIAKKIIGAVGAKKILKLDISNCFHSFYMHMIPTIIMGRDIAEENYNKFLKNSNDPTIDEKYLTYSQLDAVIRQQNMNQTNGLLPGTLYSKIIAEGMLSRIDLDLKGQNLKFSRYVDDYEVYLYDDDEKRVISTFEKVLMRYGFTLNAEKIEVVDFPYYITSNLEKIFSDHTKDSLNTADIMALFNTFFTMEKDGTKGAIRYLLKSIESAPIEMKNPALYKSYLLSVIKNNERSLVKACALLIDARATVPLTETDVKFIRDLLCTHIDLGHDLEVIWLTYLLIKTDNISHDDSIVARIAQSQNELAQLLLLRKNLLTEATRTQICQNASSWVLLYELYVAEYVDEESFKDKLNLKKNTNMYQKLKQNSFHFCEF